MPESVPAKTGAAKTGAPDTRAKPRDYCYFLDHRKYNRNAGCRRHDNLYGINGGGGGAERRDADRELLDHMRGQGDPMAWPTWLACRALGWFYFNYRDGRGLWSGQLVRRFVKAPR